MARTKIHIANDVRNAFTANFLDSSAVTARVESGRATMTGRIKRLAGCYAPVTTNTLTALELSIIHIPEVRRLRWSLDNWSNETGHWQMIKQRRTTV